MKAQAGRLALEMQEPAIWYLLDDVCGIQSEESQVPRKDTIPSSEYSVCLPKKRQYTLIDGFYNTV